MNSNCLSEESPCILRPGAPERESLFPSTFPTMNMREQVRIRLATTIPFQTSVEEATRIPADCPMGTVRSFRRTSSSDCSTPILRNGAPPSLRSAQLAHPAYSPAALFRDAWTNSRTNRAGSARIDRIRDDPRKE